MDPKKAAAEWFRSTVFKDEAIRPRPPQRAERVPSVIRAARSLENGAYQSWQSKEVVFMKQGKLLASYEDDYDYRGSVTQYYPTYQSLTDRQLRGYLSWRTKLRRGDVRETSLSFAFLYVYELLNQIGVPEPMEGYRRLEYFREAYGQIDSHILSYLDQWISDYVVYYGLDPMLLAGTPQVVFDRAAAVLEHIQEQEPAAIVEAVKQLSPGWLGRSKFYAAHREDMDAVIVRVLRRMSAHYDARCKRGMAEQYFGGFSHTPLHLFDSAVFCNPLKRRNYQYAVDEQCVYTCKNGLWSVWRRVSPPGCAGRLGALLKTIDAVMRQQYDDRHPVKAEVDTKWILRIIQEEVQGLLAGQKAAQEKKITIDYAQLTRIRQDAALTQEKLIVEEKTDLPEGPASVGLAPVGPSPVEFAPVPDAPAPVGPAPAGLPQEQLSLDALLQAGPSPGEPPAGAEDSPLSPPEYRLLQCLLYGGDTGWVQGSGYLLSVLVDGINEKLYDTFLDTVLDDTPQVIGDYIDDLKEMVHP